MSRQAVRGDPSQWPPLSPDADTELQGGRENAAEQHLARQETAHHWLGWGPSLHDHVTGPRDVAAVESTVRGVNRSRRWARIGQAILRPSLPTGWENGGARTGCGRAKPGSGVAFEIGAQRDVLGEPTPGLSPLLGAARPRGHRAESPGRSGSCLAREPRAWAAGSGARRMPGVSVQLLIINRDSEGSDWESRSGSLRPSLQQGAGGCPFWEGYARGL